MISVLSDIDVTEGTAASMPEVMDFNRYGLLTEGSDDDPGAIPDFMCYPLSAF